MNQSHTLSLSEVSSTNNISKNRKNFTIDFPSTILEEADTGDNESLVSEIDSKFENSILSFMEGKSDSYHKEMETNARIHDKYQD